MISQSFIFIFLFLSVTSCSSPKAANEDVQKQLKHKNLVGVWRFYGPFGKAANQPIEGTSSVHITPEGIISYTLRGTDKDWCNQSPKVDMFNKCEGNERESGTIVKITEDEIHINGTVFSPVLEYSLSQSGNSLKLQDINLYK